MPCDAITANKNTILNPKTKWRLVPIVLFICILVHSTWVCAAIEQFLNKTPKGGYEIIIPTSSLSIKTAHDIAAYLKQNQLERLGIVNDYTNYYEESSSQTKLAYMIILESLSENTSLKVLNLENNNLGSTGALSLAHGLQGNRSLTTIDIGYNHFDDDGILAITSAMLSNPSLRNVDLSFNRMGVNGVVGVCKLFGVNRLINRINLGGNAIGSQGTGIIANALRGYAALTCLDLHYNNIRTEGAIALVAALASLPNLEILNLSTNHIDDAGIIEIVNAIRDQNALTTLDLGNNNAGSTTMVKTVAGLLQRNPRVTTLNLEKNYISRDEIKTLLLDTLVNHNHSLLNLNCDYDPGLINAIVERNKLLAQLSSRLDLYTLGECEELHQRLPRDLIYQVLAEYFIGYNNLKYYLLMIMDGTIEKRFTKLTEEDKKLIADVMDRQTFIIRRLQQLNVPIQVQGSMSKYDCGNSNVLN